MTTPHYLRGCAAGSKASEIASGSPGDYAWYVNFGNGNAYWNNQDNDYYVRAVRSSEYHGAPCFRDLHAAWREARRGKKPSPNQLTFDAQWIDGLLELERELVAGTWRPKPTTCFIATAPKAREIHAPDFSDRILHHWLVPQLEAIYEPGFIFDSYSNRRGKGTHAAVARLRSFVRQVYSGQPTEGERHEYRRPSDSGLFQPPEGRVDRRLEGCAREKGLGSHRAIARENGEVPLHRVAASRGWYLQLDIANCFNTIHRPTLYAMVKRRMERYGLPLATRQATHALLARSPADQGVRYACTETERRSVPPHKRLENAAPGCGIAIGNLSSQFFANVYLDALDQFVKHELRVQHYLRYVDDFVLVHRSREQLEHWHAAIADFLQERLQLQLKADARLRPLSAGVDFLGYVIFSTRTVVRRRVVGHARAKFSAWASNHVRGSLIRATPVQLGELRAVYDSYAGHFSHANSWRLRQRLRGRFPWLETAVLPRRFAHGDDHRTLSILTGGSDGR